MTVTGPCNAPGVVDVVALGESMVTFLPTRPGRLADVPSFERGIGGAESNVACVLAAAGHTVRWVSRVGADGFGDHLVETIGSYGVDVSHVRRDPARPTGVYFRTAGDRSTDAHEVAYYRAGSAASAMTPGNVDMQAVGTTRILHLSGITAALSEACLSLMRELTAPRPDRPLISFDVNHRPGLWHGADGPSVLLELARGADIVFVGTDEAEEAWGVKGGPETIRALLPEPSVLVVKEGARGATVFAGEAAAPHPDDNTTADAEQRHPQATHSRADAAAGGRADVAAGGRAEAAVGSCADIAAGSRAAGAARVGAAAPRKRGQAHPPPAGTNAGQPANAARPTQSTHGTPPAPGRAPDPRPAPTPSTEPAPAPAPTQGTPQPTAFVPSLHVDIVATIGAGDAFAAGFLSATLRGLPVRDRLRHGHLMAAATLTVPGDLAEPPARTHADRLAALDDAAWETLRLGPGWTRAAEKEDRTP